jgi:hypothetical protein
VDLAAKIAGKSASVPRVRIACAIVRAATRTSRGSPKPLAFVGGTSGKKVFSPGKHFSIFGGSGKD